MRKESSISARVWFTCLFVLPALTLPIYSEAQSKQPDRVTSALTKAADKTGAALQHGAKAVGPVIDTGVSRTESGIKRGIAFVGRELERAGKKMQGEYRSHTNNVDLNQKSNAK